MPLKNKQRLSKPNGRQEETEYHLKTRKITEEQSVESRAVLSRVSGWNGSWGTSGAGRKQVDLRVYGMNKIVKWKSLHLGQQQKERLNHKSKSLVTCFATPLKNY